MTCQPLCRPIPLSRSEGGPPDAREARPKGARLAKAEPSETAVPDFSHPHVEPGGVAEGNLLGTRVWVGAGAVVKGHVLGFQDVLIEEGAVVQGNVVAGRELRFTRGARTHHAIAGQVAFDGPATIGGDLVVHSSATLTADHVVHGMIVANGHLTIAGDRRKQWVFGRDGVVVKEATKLLGVRTNGRLQLAAGVETQYAEAREGIVAGEGVLARYITSGGAVEAAANLHFERLHAASARLGPDANSSAASETRGSIVCDGPLVLGAGSRVLVAVAKGHAEMQEGSQATILRCAGDVSTGPRVSIERLGATGDVVLAGMSRVGTVQGRTVRVGAKAAAGVVEASEEAVIEQDATVGTVSAGSAVRFDGLANILHPLVLSDGAIEWRHEAPPLLWGEPLAEANRFTLDAEGNLGPSGEGRALATVLATHDLARAVTAWGRGIRLA